MSNPTQVPIRLWLSAALVLAEPLLLGVWFDGENLARLGGGAVLVANASVLLRIGSASLLALVVLLTTRQTSLDAEKHALFTYRPNVIVWAGHALSYAALILISTQVFSLSDRGSGAVAPPPPSWSLLLLWFASASATAATLACLLASPRAWSQAFTRHSTVVFSSLIVGVSTWLLGLASDKLWGPLGRATLEATARILDVVEPEIIVIPETSVIATPHFGVEVSAQCSGFEGMGLMAAFLLVVAIAGRSRLRSERILALMPFAVFGMWLTNAFRVAALLWLGSHVSPLLAMGAFHSKAGWFLFCAVALAVLALIHRLRFFQQQDLPHDEAVSAESTLDTYNPALVYLLPLVAQLGSALFTSAFASTVDFAYGLRILTIGAALWWVRRELPRLNLLQVHWVPLVTGTLAYFLWATLIQAGGASLLMDDAWLALEKPRQALQALPPVAYWAWVATRVVGSVVFVPIAEELAFRGFLLPRLISADFLSVPPRALTLVALLGSSVAFGLLHEHWLAGTLCGVLFALVRWYRGRLSDAIWAHAVVNALLALDVLLRGQWHHWL